MATDENSIDAAFSLAQTILDTSTELSDIREAVSTVMECAQAGHPRALIMTAIWYQFYYRLTPDAEQVTAEWWRKAAAKSKLAEAWIDINRIDGNDSGDRCFRILHSLDWEHDTDVQFALSHYYAHFERNPPSVIRWLNQCAVEGGHACAAFEIGQMYATLENPMYAHQYFLWYKRAAEKGHALAQYYVALCLDTGTGCDKDREQAKKWFQIAADHGVSFASHLLFHCYGIGTSRALPCVSLVMEKPLIDRAIPMYEAAAIGDPVAELNVGILRLSDFQTNQGTFAYFARAADRGVTLAHNFVGLCWLNGYGVVANTQRALESFQKASTDSAAAAYEAGLWLMKAHENAHAKVYLELAAKAGFVLAERELIALHAAESHALSTPSKPKHQTTDGDGDASESQPSTSHVEENVAATPAARQTPLPFPPQTPHQIPSQTPQATPTPSVRQENPETPAVTMSAFDRLLQAAESDHPASVYQVGLAYEEGNTAGVSPDLVQAAKWYSKAVDLHVPDAMYRLGVMYYFGSGVRQDLQRATDLLTQGRFLAPSGPLKASCFFGCGLCWTDRDPTQSFENFLMSAKLNNSAGMCMVALCYEKGAGTEQDLQKAFLWYDQAAQLGSSKGLYHTGVCYLNGQGVAKDQMKGAELLQQAVNAGSADAAYELAVCYERGKGVERLPVRAERLYSEAAHQGHKQAQLWNALFILDCPSPDKSSIALAESYLQSAAASGLVKAMLRLAECYRDGSSGIAQNGVRAVEYFNKAANAGYYRAWMAIGQMYLKGLAVDIDKEQGLQFISKAADEGVFTAQMMMVQLCTEGRDVQVDSEKALKYLRMAAEEGHALAQHALGLHLLKGDLGIVDIASGLQKLEQAAAQDYALAYLDLGLLALDPPSGHERDEHKAFRLCMTAAGMNLAAAQYQLSKMYEDGVGVQRSETEAIRYLRLAAEQGEVEALYALGDRYRNGRGVTQDAKLAELFRERAGASPLKRTPVALASEATTEE